MNLTPKMADGIHARKAIVASISLAWLIPMETDAPGMTNILAPVVIMTGQTSRQTRFAALVAEVTVTRLPVSAIRMDMDFRSIVSQVLASRLKVSVFKALPNASGDL